MFTEDSGLVKLWVSMVLTGAYKYKDVPDLSNLREEVRKKLLEVGYIIEE